MKQYLGERGVSFNEIDVASSKEGREEMVRKTGRMSVPAIEIDGTIIIGFDEAALKEKLGI